MSNVQRTTCQALAHSFMGTLSQQRTKEKFERKEPCCILLALALVFFVVHVVIPRSLALQLVWW
eukprot:scaffold776_cov347-Pavlova_lutheri.AAC.77